MRGLIYILLAFQVMCTKHAMKVIKKSRLTNGQVNHLNDPKKILNEINIMLALKHVSMLTTIILCYFFTFNSIVRLKDLVLVYPDQNYMDRPYSFAQH